MTRALLMAAAAVVAFSLGCLESRGDAWTDRVEAEARAGSAAMAAAGCPEEHAAVVRLNRRDFERCHSLASRLHIYAAGTYAAVEEARAFGRALDDWEARRKACRVSDHCAVVEQEPQQ